MWNVNVTTDNWKVVQETDVVFLAVKPHLVEEVIDKLSEHKDTIKDKLFVSILAGIPLKRLESVSIPAASWGSALVYKTLICMRKRWPL